MLCPVFVIPYSSMNFFIIIASSVILPFCGLLLEMLIQSTGRISAFFPIEIDIVQFGALRAESVRNYIIVEWTYTYIGRTPWWAL